MNYLVISSQVHIFRCVHFLQHCSNIIISISYENSNSATDTMIMAKLQKHNTSSLLFIENCNSDTDTMIIVK